MFTSIYFTSAPTQPNTQEEPPADGSQTATEQNAKKPLLSLAVILRLLAELGKSYAAIARLIVDYTVDTSSCSRNAKQYLTVSFISFFLSNNKLSFRYLRCCCFLTFLQGA